MFESAARTVEDAGAQAMVIAALQNDRFQANNPGGLWAARIKGDNAFKDEVLAKEPAEIARTHRETAAAFFGRSDFVFSVTRDFVRTCAVPLLILAGHDDFHPTATAREIADLAPNATYVEDWATPDLIPTTIATARAFLEGHLP